MEQAGAVSYVVKMQAAVELVQAIRDVLQRTIYVSPQVARAVVQAYLTGTCSVENLHSPAYISG
jgi:DNA-binding NarL/FixJ family response regulator